MKNSKLPIIQILGFVKAIVALTIIFVSLALGYMYRDYLWNLSAIARSYYFVWLGDESLNKGNFQEAIDDYKTALNIYPEHAKAHYNLGNIYFAYELYSAPAENTIVKVYKYDTRSKRYLLSSIDVQKKYGFDENNAESAYLAAIQQDPNYQNAYINLGLIKSANFDYDGAIFYFSKAINSRPQVVKIPFIFDNEKFIRDNKAIAWYNLGNAYFHKATESSIDSYRNFWLNKSLDALMSSYKIDNLNYKTNYNLANTYQILKRDTNAINHYCKAIKIDPQKYEPHYNLGVLFIAKNDYLSASDEIKKAALLIDIGKYDEKSKYIFTVLNEVGNRAAAKVLAELNRYAASDTSEQPNEYPVPSKGIIHDVLFASTSEATKDSNNQKNSDQKMNKDENPASDFEKNLNMELSSCYTDADYRTKLYDLYAKSPQWIYLGQKPIDQ